MTSWPMALSVSLVGLGPLALLAAVALPAVWSSRPARRRAAVGVLAQLLGAGQSRSRAARRW